MTWRRTALLMLLAGVPMACSESNQDEPRAQALLQSILSTDFEGQGWGFPVGYGPDEDGNLPESHTLHGAKVRVLLNPTMLDSDARTSNGTNFASACNSAYGNGPGRVLQTRVDNPNGPDPLMTAWPDGSMVVKFALNDDGSDRHVAAMEKRDGVWFFAEYAPDGTVEFSGEPELCVGCHEGARNDMIFTAHFRYVCRAEDDLEGILNGDFARNASECVSFLRDFDDGICVAKHCTNGVQDAGETDVDCGSSVCGKCEDGQACSSSLDCDSGTCTNGTCQPVAECSNGVQDREETDVDCGSNFCGDCAVGQGCDDDLDCESRSCVGNTCQAAGG